MREEILEILGEVKQHGENMLAVLTAGQMSAEDFSQKALATVQVIESLKAIIPEKLYKEYDEFFDSFSLFCKRSGDSSFLAENVDMMASSLELFAECLEDLRNNYVKRVKKCPCCGGEVIYTPLSAYYSDMRKKLGIVSNAKSETLNRDEYLCPVCGASDRDRLIVSFLKIEGLQQAAEGTKFLQFAPSAAISKWITKKCPQIDYETTDLFMDQVTFKSDIMDMAMVPDETYDVMVCSHVLEHVKDDIKALSEMKRVLKKDGKIIFLVPIDLNASEVDEEWGLSEAENWRRFGQGDHCRRYSKAGLMERLREQFHVYNLGKEYFGEDVFGQCGLTDTSTLYVLTRSQDVPLNMAEKVMVDEKLCQEGPLVSVILPCYNHENFVAQAIESVINQSYKNIELIVGDDGSTDNSVEVMKRYSSWFTKEFYYDKNTGSITYSLSQHATGKYIALMHSDDIWEKDKLALQVAYMERHEECGVCFSWCKYVDENLKELDSDIFLAANRDRYEWMQHFWKAGNRLCNPSSLVRREIGVKASRYGRACRQLPDFFRWVDIIQYTSIHVIPKVLIRMRRYQTKERENTSSESRENRVRHLFEEGGNWLWVIRDMEKDFFKKSFRELMIYPESDTETEIKCEKYFLMLNHSNIFVQNSAMCYFFEIFNEVGECMEKKYNYTRLQFASDMISRGVVATLKEEYK